MYVVQLCNRPTPRMTESLIVCAAIVSPYDDRLSNAISQTGWFYVEHPSGQLPSQGERLDAAGCIVKALRTEKLEASSSSVADILAMPAGDMCTLAQRYANLPHAVDLARGWRDSRSGAQKLVESLAVSSAVELRNEGGKCVPKGSASFLQGRAPCPCAEPPLEQPLEP